tara:strand:- start:910 stop:1227 length:318 start_codon:yes stop_codon:yes gene_type:complete
MEHNPMNKTVLSLAALIGLSATGGAFAQALDFNSLDANADGVISMEELQVAIPDLTAESFAMLDTDTDGSLSAEEFAALMPATEAPANTMEAPMTDAPMEAPAAQ